MPLKICSCGHQCGPRTKICQCGKSFSITPSFLRSPKGEEIFWRNLQPDDIIKIVQGSGNYYPLEGKKVYLIDGGIYKITSVVDAGFYAVKSSGKKRGDYTWQCAAQFINMLDSGLNETGVFRQSVKFKKIG